MKPFSKILFLCSGVVFFFAGISYTQQTSLILEGDLQLSQSSNDSPVPGTIRWTGLNFEGWNGVTWELLTDFEVASVITDVDGNEYRTVKIGTQEWMAQNLRVTKYNDGTAIGDGALTSDWKQSVPRYCWYQNDSATYANPYGALYNYYAVADTNSRNVCPDGWQVPTESQINDLRDFLGTDAGGKVKHTGTQYWSAPNTGATNVTRFTALPVGLRSSANGFFFSHGNNGFYWSSTEYNETTARFIVLSYNNSDLGIGSTIKGTGISVRCIKLPEEE